jgi:hypothetical protein
MVDGKIMLKLILEKQGTTMWAKFSWLRREFLGYQLLEYLAAWS